MFFGVSIKMMIRSGLRPTFITQKICSLRQAIHDYLAHYFVSGIYLVWIVLFILFGSSFEYLAVLFVLAVIPLSFFVCQLALFRFIISLSCFSGSITMINSKLAFFTMPIQSIFRRAINVEFRPRFVFLTSGTPL